MDEEILARIKKGVLEYNIEGSVGLVEEAILARIDPLRVMDVLVDAIREVGEGFAKGELFLPELVMAANILETASPIAEKAIKDKGEKRRSLGIVVIGTVFGDIHTIGKSMVASLLTADGFEVRDLGINVPSEKFIEAVKEYKPDVLAMSALLTTTAPETKKVIDRLRELGLMERVKIMVGGGAMSESLARRIGADGYASLAPGAVKLARDFISVRNRGK